MLLTPHRQNSGDDNPVVVHTPGTRGLGDHCAPSKQADLATANPSSPDYSAFEYHQFLANGVSVVLTDYLGQGTPGLPEYLIGPSEGYNGLDAVRAAQRVADSGLSLRSPVGITGYSQGGQAAAWAAELQPRYAPELDLRGVLAGGVPSDMLTAMNHLDGNPTAAAGFAIAALVGQDAGFPELDLDSLLTTQGKQAVERASQACYGEDLFLSGTIEISDVTRTDVLNLPAWREAFAKSRLGTTVPGAPAYVYHATSDTVVSFGLGRQLYADWCTRGADVMFEKILGLEHLAGAVLSSPAGITWLVDRLHGEPAQRGCYEVGVD